MLAAGAALCLPVLLYVLDPVLVLIDQLQLLPRSACRGALYCLMACNSLSRPCTSIGICLVALLTMQRSDLASGWRSAKHAVPAEMLGLWTCKFANQL